MPKEIQSKEANYAMWLGFIAAFWTAVIINVPFWIVMYQKKVNGQERAFSPWIGLGLMGVEILLAIASLFLGLKGYKKGDRSWKIFLGISIGGLVLFIGIMFLVGEFIFPH